MLSSYKLPGTNGAGSKLTIGATASSLVDLIRTASGNSDFILPTEANAIDIYSESNDFRWFDDGNIPTDQLGNPVSQGSIFQLRGVAISKMQLIRSGTSDAVVTIRVGYGREV